MIAYLKGQVQQKTDRSILLVMNGVGYQVAIPESWLLQIKKEDEVEVYTHLHFSTRDESVIIYGMPSPEELAFFEQLISVSGVGRRSALAALSVAKLPDLQKTISQSDSALLQKVAGIGRKTAERIVVELKDKVLPGDGATSGISGIDGEVIQALEGLGYSMADIRDTIRQLPSELETSEDRVKAVLKMLGK